MPESRFSVAQEPPRRRSPKAPAYGTNVPRWAIYQLTPKVKIDRYGIAATVGAAAWKMGVEASDVRTMKALVVDLVST